MSAFLESIGLWKRTLAPRARDEHAKPRDRLRMALLNMRANAAQLVKLIPMDCRQLTVHDVSHLDALWEMADIISGETFDLNPAEAFVFGASVLVHDAGMSVAAYPGGIEQIKKTTEWRDTVYAVCRQAGVPPTPELISEPPVAQKSEILFHVLRALHAKHAELLAIVTWPLPETGENVRLLEDLSLRTSYGRAIGRIAHSHHWSIEKVVQLLRNSVGAAADLPQEWQVDEIKVACLLRCADAAHIDHRRAPSMLYALLRPHGVSQLHWNFQNKLNKPTISDGTLIYSSGENFSVTEAPAWWMCFDAVKMINKEIQDSNGVLIDNGSKGFDARRVFGAEGPSLLARQVQVVDWRPVDAEIRVSDPIRLAQTLGGRNLYGNSALAPIRELVQNAADAVRARRKNEGRSSSWGSIRITLEDVAQEEGVKTWLHIDDNGIGMSERILIGPLLDFGHSLWNSSLLREEWPGLESSGLQPIGKFGIGFFSVFSLSETVKVISRRYDAAALDTRVVEFTSISRRPLLRDARAGELPADFNTRISVQIPNLTYESRDANTEVDEVALWQRRKGASGVPLIQVVRGLFKSILTLISALDIQVDVNFEATRERATHDADWLMSEPEKFFYEVLSSMPNEDRLDWQAAHSDRLTILRSDSGDSFGRAALRMYKAPREHDVAGLSVGGLVASPGREFFVGVMKGETKVAARNRVDLDVPDEVLKNWASDQAERIDQSRFALEDLIEAARKIVSLGGDSKALPYCFSGGKTVTYGELRNIVNDCRALHVMLELNYHGGLDLVQRRDLRLSSFDKDMKKNVVLLESAGFGALFDRELGRRLVDEGGGLVALSDIEDMAYDSVQEVIELAESFLGDCVLMTVEQIHVCDVNYYRQPPPVWVLTLSPGSADSQSMP